MNKNQLWMLGSSYVVRASTILITCMLIISNVFVLFCHQKEMSIKFLVKACDGSQLVLVPSSLREVTEKKSVIVILLNPVLLLDHMWMERAGDDS